MCRIKKKSLNLEIIKKVLMLYGVLENVVRIFEMTLDELVTTFVLIPCVQHITFNRSLTQFHQHGGWVNKGRYCNICSFASQVFDFGLLAVFAVWETGCL